MSRTVIVDDQDGRITYIGLWSLAGTEKDYRGTASSSSVSGATMSFSFSGTSLAVIGDLSPGGRCNATFSLDGKPTVFSSPNVNDTQAQFTLFNASSLDDGQHILVYTLNSCASSADPSASGQYLWLDYLLYGESQSSSTAGARYFVDDSDAQVQYSGDWVENGQAGNFLGTLHSAKNGAGFNFTFTGSFISVFGQITGSQPGNITRASFSVDGAESTIFAAMAQDNTTYNNQLFASPQLASGEHQLSVSALSDNPLHVDYFLIQPGGSPTTSASPSASNTSTISSGNEHRVPIGAVVGGSAGGLLMIIAVILAFLCLKRRRGGSPPQRGKKLMISQPLKPPPSPKFSQYLTTPHSYPPSSSQGSSPPLSRSGTFYTGPPRLLPSSSSATTTASSSVPGRSERSYTSTAHLLSSSASSSTSSERRRSRSFSDYASSSAVNQPTRGRHRSVTISSLDEENSDSLAALRQNRNRNPTSPPRVRPVSTAPSYTTTASSSGYHSSSSRRGHRPVSTAPSYTTTASSSGYQSSRRRRAATIINNPDEDGDSVKALKRRQEAVMNSDSGPSNVIPPLPPPRTPPPRSLPSPPGSRPITPSQARHVQLDMEDLHVLSSSPPDVGELPPAYNTLA